MKIVTIKYYEPRIGYVIKGSEKTEYKTKGKIKIIWHLQKLNSFFYKIKNFLYREIEKYYRLDINVWEKKIRVIGINIYKQVVFLRDKNKLKVRYKLRIPKKAEKMYRPTITEVYITHKEWVKEYKCNKYLVPVNYKIPEEFLKSN